MAAFVSPVASSSLGPAAAALGPAAAFVAPFAEGLPDETASVSPASSLGPAAAALLRALIGKFRAKGRHARIGCEG